MVTTSNNRMNMQIKEENSDSQINEIEELEWSPDQEILLLYSLHGYKPVGPNKHFRMLLIQDRLSSALNKRISSLAIWKKLNTLYDLEALDEAEAEADAPNVVETEFSLPDDEFGELMAQKVIKSEKSDPEYENNMHQIDAIVDIKLETVDSDTDETVKGTPVGKELKNDMSKKGPKKKDLTPGRDSLVIKKEKEILKRDTPNKKDNIKEGKKVIPKDDEKKDIGKKPTQESKTETSKEERREPINKANKKEAVDRRLSDQSKKDAEVKKADLKKVIEPSKIQRADIVKTRPETPKQLRADSSKRTETKLSKTDTSRTQRVEPTIKPQRIEAHKKYSLEKKKETQEKKVERKSPEKTPESARGAKLRTREKKEESDKTETPTGTKRERSRDASAKASETPEEPQAKKAKISGPKGRPTRNSIEPQKPASPAVNLTSPQKRRTRLQ